MRIYYLVHILVERNIGNYEHEEAFISLDEAKSFRDEINNYHGRENITKRDSYAYRISTHAFKNDSNAFIFAHEHGLV
jgi:hypothetical protein